MPTIGERLRTARLQQGRSLSELANEICITSRYLTAIEADDPKPLPGAFFHRNFVKQYAAALKLDADAMAHDFDAVYPPEDSDPLPALAEAYMPRSRWRSLF